MFRAYYTMIAIAAVIATAAAAEGGGPCDILGAVGNPCVAAHSTVRALYAKYDGPLYNVTRKRLPTPPSPLLPFPPP